VPVGVDSSQSQSVGYETGIRKRLTSGGTLSLSQGQTYTDDRTTGTVLSPDPAQSTFLDISLDQPLLRGFGSDVALAEVRLTENIERRAIHEYKARLINSVTSTERAYWNLVAAYRTLQIRQRVLQRGIETRDVLQSRLQFDVRPSEYSDAVATVERRRGDVIRAENDLRQRSDDLKLLINDDELTVGNEALLLPADEALEQPVRYSLLDSVTTAMQYRPEVQQALLGIDDASIRQTVADNARLPLLDLSFQSRFQGLSEETDEAYEDIGEGQFVDFLVGALFEQPIGNRGAEADYRRRQLERMAATVDYRATLQRVVLEVKTALRNVTTNWQLIEQARSSRLAATENLRTLLVQEQTIQSLTPDFLDLKFRRQDSLAQAEIDEVGALTDYNIALAELSSAMGTALERNRIEFVVPDAADAAAAPRERERE
jgi:outer membrane protein TolC